jgi:hypothetical protein
MPDTVKGGKQLIVEQCCALIQAYTDMNLREEIKIGKQLAPILESAYYNSPELFQDKDVKRARNIIRRLARAQYIKRPKQPVIYRGGSPGLGKKK